MRNKRVRLFLDGRSAFSLAAEVAAQAGLRAGTELTDSQVDALVTSDQRQRCFDAAARYLHYRPRSESELRERLRQRGFAGETVENVLGRLKQQGLVDDAAFTRFWKENRETFSPRSQQLAMVELRKKGIAEDIITQTMRDVDDAESAYRAAASKVRRLSGADYDAFRRRLGQYLRRRGFSYSVIDQTVARCWQEIEEQG
ncbi:MAG: RecX family transcriptional regulator [Chloroflexi bacterium]|nr:RecX family transcriptional regulator [Chloroflexota bacterium]